MTNIIWLRRNLRLDDNLVLQQAIASKQPLIVIFIFDTDILTSFPNPNDLRVSFIASQLTLMRKQLQKYGHDLYIFHGSAKQIIPQITQFLKSDAVFADYGFEPLDIARDEQISTQIHQNTKLQLYNDHLLLHPTRVIKNDGNPYKVYTPYMRAFRQILANEENIKVTDIHLKQINSITVNWNHSSVQPIKFVAEKDLMEKIGYQYSQHPLWKPQDAQIKFKNFIIDIIEGYKQKRDFMSQNGTSSLSPYLRFGMISIRQLYLSASFLSNEGRECWINELIWREFYSMLLFHYPRLVNEEMQNQYINTIPWQNDQEMLGKVYNAQTGLPIIDAAITQLLQDGWMHNRMRMVFASFFSKNLMLDWRIGEKFFAQHLMDYELASNVGGWQWAASVGSDAQPYFRIFNPLMQSAKFDANGEYIKHYMPILRSVSEKDLHSPNNLAGKYNINYPEQMVDLKTSRARAIKIFRAVSL